MVPEKDFLWYLLPDYICYKMANNKLNKIIYLRIVWIGCSQPLKPGKNNSMWFLTVVLVWWLPAAYLDSRENLNGITYHVCAIIAAYDQHQFYTTLLARTPRIINKLPTLKI